MVGCSSHGSGTSPGPDASVQPVPDGGCLQATDCPSGSHCNCGFLNVDFATSGCESPGTCITAPPMCSSVTPAEVLCDKDGGCALGGTCGGFGYCTPFLCPVADASSDSGPLDSGIDADAGLDSGAMDSSPPDAPSAAEAGDASDDTGD